MRSKMCVKSKTWSAQKIALHSETHTVHVSYIYLYLPENKPNVGNIPYMDDMGNEIKPLEKRYKNTPRIWEIHSNKWCLEKIYLYDDTEQKIKTLEIEYSPEN